MNGRTLQPDPIVKTKLGIPHSVWSGYRDRDCGRGLTKASNCVVSG